MTTTSLPIHLPLRPSWDCDKCGRSWPCDPAREALTLEFRRFPLSLTAYMAAQYAVAVDDLWRSDGMPADLYERFLTWCNRLHRNPKRKEEEMDLNTAHWVRSTRCDNRGPNCVEVAHVGDSYVVRNSKEPAQFLEFTTGEWEAFVAGVVIGEFRF